MTTRAGAKKAARERVKAVSVHEGLLQDAVVARGGRRACTMRPGSGAVDPAPVVAVLPLPDNPGHDRSACRARPTEHA
ncbi:MAG: hypothetical protein KY456_08475 [Chloroflexi bacterium]|nr:hypothetical protein [Chloroflexota bacterium]